MLNNNAFRTSLIFLGMISLAIIVRMFLVEDESFVQDNPKDAFANVTCIFSSNC